MKYRLTLVLMAVVLIICILSCAPKKENIPQNDDSSVSAPTELISQAPDFPKPEQEIIPLVTEPAVRTGSHTISIKNILQNPELPTGCEITSLAMVLNYLGYDISKTELAENYLKRGSLGKASFNDAFIGNPASDGGYGCFAPVIVTSAQKYLIERTMDCTAWNLSGTEFTDLFDYIDDDIPVIVWASMNLMDVTKTEAYYGDNGNSVTWYENEHCVVLCGYDIAENTVTVADPLKGMMKYDTDRFIKIYNTLEKQAVVIK